MAILKNIKIQFLKLIRPLVKNYVPRRFIFMIDVCIAFVAAQAAFFLIHSATGTNHPIFTFTWPLFAIVGIQAVYYIIIKSYFGLVRYSSFKDVITQLKVTSLSVVTILLINHIYYLTSSTKLILDAGVIIYGFITFSLLFFFRVLVKRTYQSINASKTSTSAYILGTDRADIAMGEGLISEHSDSFNIIGFVNLDNRKMLTRIYNLPIYSISQLKASNTLAKAIIVSDEKLQHIKNEDSTILNELLDLKLKIYKLPKIQDYNNNPSFSSLKEVKIEDLLQRSPIKLNNLKLSELYKDKVILVTGAAGSIGSEIVKQLIPFSPKKIILLDQAETPLHTISLCLDKDFPELNYEKVIANVRSKKRLREIFETYQPQIVFHGAAYKHVPMMEANPIESLSVNFYGTRNLVELATEFNIERFVFVSTDKAVNPTNIMGASKRAAEIYIQSLAQLPQQKTTFITTRFGNVLGSNGSVIPHFKKQIAEGGPVTVTHPEITRYFMTIDEACQLVLEAGGMGNGGEIYVFDMGSPIKIINLAHHMIRLTGLVPNEDIAIEFTGLRPGEKLYEELLADKETTLPTHHEKIMIAQATHTYDSSQDTQLSELLQLIKQNNIKEALQKLKFLVPEYIPANIEDFKIDKNHVQPHQIASFSDINPKKISDKL